jgi:two-component system response regulator DevR
MPPPPRAATERLTGIQHPRPERGPPPERDPPLERGPPPGARPAPRARSPEGALLPAEGALLPTEGALLPTEGALLPPEGALVPTEGALLPTEGALLPTDGALLPRRGTRRNVPRGADMLRRSRPAPRTPTLISSQDGRSRGDGCLMKVALIDDHDIVAVAVESVVARVDGLEYIGSAATVPELLTAHPVVDIAILDLRLQDGSSPVSNVERLVEAGARTIVLTSGESPFLVRSVAKSPIFALVRKSAPRELLAEALRTVASGDMELSTEWAAAMDADPQLDAARLSAQEQRVLALFARGVKAQSVAYELGITIHTVDDYVRRIRAKYAGIGRPARTKVDLYRRAVEDGILPSTLIDDAAH